MLKRQSWVTPPPSSFVCSALDVTQIDRTRFDFTAHATVVNSTVSSYNFVVKNSSGKVVDNQTVTTNALSAIYHFNQSTPDTYSVSAAVTTNLGTSSSSKCVKQVTVAPAPIPPTPPTPPVVKAAVTPTALPNTGAGGVLGVFAGASILGTAGHYLVRRFRRA